jgi:3D (Asp-Asp-Asp) domain-containing protein
VVAADPKVLPLGSKVEVQGAGEHSGTYVVEDTGPAVKGHELDLYVPDDREAKRFGRKDVEVKVLERGDGRDGKPEQVPGPTGRK